VHVGGTTSVDVTEPGIDKAYGMIQLMNLLEMTRKEILFFGDKLEEGGKRSPGQAMGIDSIAVRGWSVPGAAMWCLAVATATR
jgi:hypothetical protein